MRTAILTVVALATLVGVAEAYPQYQLSKEQTCASCHVSPAGGGLLGDNGELTAEDEAQWGGDPTFLHGAVELPAWLRLGGDIRLAGGASDHGAGFAGAFFPMQTEVYGAAESGALSAYVTAGLIVKEETPWPVSREHWVMWRPEAEGVYLRAGRFLPGVGLRQAEHVFYTRRYGGAPLWGEAYGVNAGYVTAGLEAHATAFVADPLVDGVERGSGGALYLEKRIGADKAIGVEERFAISDDDTRNHAGVTAKWWLDGPGLLLQAEGQLVRQSFRLDAAAPTRFQLVGQLLATYFIRAGLFVDVGLGHYDADLDLKDLDRDALDVNVHWFPTSHTELILTTRYQRIGLGNGGDDSAYALLQAHYRL